MDMQGFKRTDAIDNGFITRTGYEEVNNMSVLKTCHTSIVDDDENDKEATMNIPPPTPTNAPSPTVGVSSSATLFDYASAFQVS